MTLHLGKGRKVQAQLPLPMPPESEHTLPAVEPDTPVVQEFTLVGVTFSGYPFETLRLYQPVQLVPDPYGQVVKPEEGHPDPHALSIQDEARRHIGYLPKAHAQVITAFWKENPDMRVQAHVLRIKGGTDGLSYGVDVLVRFGVDEEQVA